MRALLLLLCLTFGQSTLVHASSGCEPASPDCVEVGKWQVSVALGAGVRTNPVVEGKDIPLIVLPEITYNGERFFIHNLDLGAILWESPTQQLNLLLTPSFDQVFFHRWDPANFVLETAIFAQPGPVNNPVPEFNGPEKSDSFIDAEATKRVDISGLHERRMAALAGLEYSHTVNDWDIQAQWLADVSGIHDGTELRLAIARQHRWDRHAVVFSVGANWQSDAVTDYYYGIRTDEVALIDDAYQADAGISGFAGIDWYYSLNKRWTLRFNGSYRHLADEISRSPIVEDDRVFTAFFGGVYHF